MRCLLLCLLCCVLLCPPTLAAEPAILVPIDGAVVAPDTPTPAARLRQFTHRERKDLGLTFRDLLPEVRAMRRAGTLEGKTSEDVALEILAKRAETPAFKALPGGEIDWDAVLIWLEKLIALVMKFIAMFGGI